MIYSSPSKSKHIFTELFILWLSIKSVSIIKAKLMIYCIAGIHNNWRKQYQSSKKLIFTYFCCFG